MTEPHVLEVAARPHRRALVVWLAAATVILVGVTLVLIYRPWQAPPPMPHDATALPTVCPELLGIPAPTSSLPGGSRGADGESWVGASCQWGSAGPNELPPLTAKYSLFQRNGNHSGTEEAQRDAASLITVYNGPTKGFTVGADTPIAGVGDEARITFHGNLVVLVARKANVVLYLEFDGYNKGDNAQVQAIVTAAARKLLDQVSLT